MSELLSDAESSCEWTIVSNEGSDIETLGSEATVDYGSEPLEREEVQLQDTEERRADSLDDTLAGFPVDQTPCVSESRHAAAGTQHVSPLSSSHHSDIMTLDDSKDDEAAAAAAAAAKEELYLGTSCSSLYAFTAAQTVFSTRESAVANSSSSSDDDEAGRGSGTVVRRRRLRKSTTSTVTEPEEEREPQESGLSEELEDEEQVKDVVQQEGPAGFRSVTKQQSSSFLNSCIFLALVVAVSMGFGHFHGTVQIQERQSLRVSELYVVRDLLQHHMTQQPPTEQRDLDDVDEHGLIYLLTEVIDKIKEENQELGLRQMHIQTQKDELELLFKQKTKEQTNIVSEQQRLTAENQQLKQSLEHEEKSFSTLQDEVRNLRMKISVLEKAGAGTDSLRSENQRLKDQLEEEKLLMRHVQSQREELKAEAQTVIKKLNREKKVTDELRRELNQLRSHIHGAGTDGGAERQSRLRELEKRLRFEQQRSDLWERLYVETKEERAKGDTAAKVKRPRIGMSGQLKVTFDAVKNSTKEFVHHHKEQIEKAKEVVKQNLKKFSDCVKSTFRHFKNSASDFISKARGFYSRNGDEMPSEWWHHMHHTPHRGSSHNTRKPGDKAHVGPGQSRYKATTCSGVLGGAYQESTSPFNKATEPIRADEFQQLLQSYMQQEVEHFHHWKELETFINNFFHNGVFIHDRMLFTDFVASVKDYLSHMPEYHAANDHVFGDVDDFICKHFFGETHTNTHGPTRPFERGSTDSKDESRSKHQQRKQQRSRSQPHSERRWSRSGGNADRHAADVKIELGPMPFDPKY